MHRASVVRTAVTQWIRDEHFDTALPNAPKITNGKVVAQSNGVRAVA